MMRRSLATFTGLLLLLAAGCVGTSTGNPFDGDGDDGPLNGEGVTDVQDGGEITDSEREQGCIHEPRVIDVEAATDLGFSARDILAFAEGEHTQAARWNAPSDVTVEPTEGDDEVTVAVEYGGGEVRFVDSVPDPDFALDIATFCRGRLEIDVTITLRTSGGALDETFDATLVATSELLARVDTRLDPEALQGALSITPDAAGWTVGTMQLNMEFTPFGNSGAMYVFLEMRSEDASSESAAIGRDSSGALLSWGGGGECEHGHTAVDLDDEVLGTRASDLASAMAAIESATVTWRDGSTSAATLALQAGENACVQLETHPEEEFRQLAFGATLEIATDDGALDGSWAVTAIANLSDDSPTEVVLGTDWQRLGNQAALDMPFGFSGLDTAGYDDFSLDLSLTYALDAEGAATLGGDFTLQGLLPPDCDPAIEYDEDGNIIATGGCPGSEQVNLTSASISSP